ncbi:hypothetical protein V5P93_002731 [Actinokineospora auranticolor]|uniref:DUF5709 domain-containing protein n=1 Tax=Actinokineospora auranticolor TaxID=155976 RepID=A0A2S6H055_9PSEU|nr:hypothetical protein [Actinokineospora auranticolor]PPK70869.1 hypothetical protein CLV40_10155 [Actinokineospora auranticolor]
MSTDGYPADLSQAEALDEDNLRVDPLEEGVEPPERWAEADRFGMTVAEQRAGETLDQRLAEEEPDVAPDDSPGPDTPLREVDDRIDTRTDDLDDPAPPEPHQPLRTEAERDGRSADEAGGSVAEALREGR